MENKQKFTQVQSGKKGDEHKFGNARNQQFKWQNAKTDKTASQNDDSS